MEDSDLPVVLDEDTTLPVGTRLGKYQIVRLLGAGGMGAVYEAFHTEIGKRVAVKTLAPHVAAVAGARQRFLREAQLTSRLRHPHIVDLSDMGTEGRIAYLVMELLSGEDLSHRLERSGPMVARDLVDLMLPVCSALIAAHEAGIVHRDLKPQNIFLSNGPRGVDPKVLDFGISKSSDSDASAGLTGTGSVIGTPHYLAPEQIKDARSASAASDQYSLGVIFYRCLTDTNPFEGDSIFSVLQAIVTERPVPIGERRTDLPEGLARVVERAMNPQPWERFPTVRELGRALLPFASAKSRVIWEETFTTGVVLPVVPLHASQQSHTMPMPTPGRPMPRPGAEIRKANPRVDSGTLPPAVTTSLNLTNAPRSKSRGIIIGTVVVAGLAGGAFALVSRPSVAPAPLPVAPSAASTAAEALPVAAPPPAAPPVAPRPVTPPPPAAALDEPDRSRKAARATGEGDANDGNEGDSRERGAKTPTAPAHRRATPEAHHGSSHARKPPAAPHDLNPNGAPVLD